MREGVGIFLQFIFSGAWLLTLAAGIYLYRNDEKIFGAREELPSETDADRGYNRTQVWAVWVHLIIFLAIFAISFSFAR